MKVICVGRNYADHIEELENKRPEHPVLFSKYDTSVFYDDKDFYIPDFSENIHYEVELLVKIKKVGKYIAPKYAGNYFDKIGLGIDFTARDVQEELKNNGLPWEKAKAFDHSALVSRHWLNRSDSDLNNLNFSLLKNGKTVQQGNSSLMLWDINHLIAEISRYFTLKIGDIIFTGTPKGVGKIDKGDVLQGTLAGKDMFKLKVR